MKIYCGATETFVSCKHYTIFVGFLQLCKIYNEITLLPNSYLKDISQAQISNL